MISKNIKQKITVLAVTAMFVCTVSISAFAQGTQKAVSLGANLTTAQKEQMLKEFNITKDQAKIIEITNDDIRIQLGLDRSKPVTNHNSYSSSYVEVLNSGGIRVKTNNLTEVTPSMLMNALLTSGVTDANVIASAPFPVTGTAALAGILKGFEDATGKELSLNQKEAARDEIKVTTDLGNNVTKEDGTKLDKDEAAVIINDIKTQVIKDSPKNDIAIENIIVNVTNNYGVQLPKEQKAQVVKLMSDINKLDYNYKDMKDSLTQMSKNLKDTLKDMGKEIKESGILEKIWNKVKDFFSWIGSLFNDNNTDNEIKYDSNGNIEAGQVDTTTTEGILNENNTDTPKEKQQNSNDKNQPTNKENTDKENQNSEKDSNSTLNNDQSNTQNNNQNNTEGNTQENSGEQSNLNNNQ